MRQTGGGEGGGGDLVGYEEDLAGEADGRRGGWGGGIWWGMRRTWQMRQVEGMRGVRGGGGRGGAEGRFVSRG